MTSGGMLARPRYSDDEAVVHARALVGRGVYQLGSGDIDSPDDGPSDCFLVCKLHGLRRHRPGFNRGPWATVSDDLNYNSAIEDADHHRELFERVFTPAPGIYLAYPTIRLPGHLDPWIGHGAIIVGVSRCREWDHDHPNYSLLDVVQCRGPNGRRPGVIASDGAIWDHHDATWPKKEHRAVMLRVLP